jgi:hypothetical protein
VGEWESTSRSETCDKVRFFYGTFREVEVENGKIAIELEGEQFADGTVHRFIYVSEHPTPYMANGYEYHKEGPATGPMSFEDAGLFGAALIAASDEQARWAQLDAGTALSDPESTIAP